MWADMAKKRADHLREVITNADPQSPQPPRPLPPGIPIIPLGYGEGGMRYYVNACGQVAALLVKEHTRLQIEGMFGTEADMVHTLWPRKKTVTRRDGSTEEIITGWRPEDGAQILLAHSAIAPFSPMEKVRGRGCWLGENGELVVSTGASLLIGGEWRRPGLFGEYVMVARNPIMKPAPVFEWGGPNGCAAEILSLFSAWNWRRPIDARLLLGWLVCGFWGAALPIRPVGWLLGPRNTGKSTLQTALADLAGGWLISVLDPTPAGITQTLKHDCLAIGIDEAEPDEDKDNRRRLNDLVRLARWCFSGGRMLRGSSEGEATEYALRSAILFSSISTPPLLPQDRSRMILMLLGKLLPGQLEPDLSPQRLRALGARLLRRAIDGWPHFAATRAQYRIALRAAGHEGRSVELFATTLAAADVVLSDDPVDSDSAAELAAQLDAKTLLEGEDDLSESELWLRWLLSIVIPLDGTGRRETIATWLRQAIAPADEDGTLLLPGPGGKLWPIQIEADRVLAQYGVKVIRPKAGLVTKFAIANHGAGIERIHASTRWAGRSGAVGGWKPAARGLEGAKEVEQRFGEWRGKGTALPLLVAFPPEEQAAKEEELCP
jgi:hypothetical protein